MACLAKKIFLTYGLLDELRNWRVDQSFSDHAKILFELDCPAHELEKIRNWKEGHWAKFCVLTDMKDLYEPRKVNCKKLDKMLSSFYKAVHSSLDEVCPATTVKKSSRSFSWYNGVHRDLSKRVNKSYLLSRKTKQNEDHETYKQELRDYKRLCRRDRNRSWNRFIECTSNVTEMSKLNRIIQGQNRDDINIFHKEDGSCTEPGKETLSHLITTHFSSSTDVVHIKYSSTDPHPLLDDVRNKYLDWLNAPLMTEALRRWIRKKEITGS